MHSGGTTAAWLRSDTSAAFDLLTDVTAGFVFVEDDVTASIV